MAITKFIPEKKKIRDNRNPEGGFYEAVCDSCGTVFYPKRANAKYCNSKCAQNSFRAKIAAGEIPKKLKPKPGQIKETVKSDKTFFLIGAGAVYRHLKSNVGSTYGQREMILDSLNTLENGETFHWLGTDILKVSERKFKLSKE